MKREISKMGNDTVILRDMLENDVEDYVRWFTEETGWMEMDAPWEKEEINDPESERQQWQQYYQSVRDLPDGKIRWKFEIEYNGRHVGWVSSYDDLQYMDNPEEIPAIGIDMPDESAHNRGVGTKALRMFMNYLHGKGYDHVYLQSWSGDAAMLRVAEKLGFREICRIKDHRTVNGRKYDAITFMAPTVTEESKPLDQAYAFVSLRDQPQLIDEAAQWFHEKWKVAKQAYLDCMQQCLDDEVPYDWYLCLFEGRIVGGLGIIDNDFHKRKDLSPNVCAVYVEKDCRNRGIAEKLLNMAVDDMRGKGVSPLYLLTDHTGFYERYGWQFYCMAENEDSDSQSRLYIHY